MTCKERIKGILSSAVDINSDSAASLEKLIYLAYYMGREASARELSDKINAHLKDQREAANACRYRHMAEKIIGSAKYIYSPDYAGEVTEMFCGDPADI